MRKGIIAFLLFIFGISIFVYFSLFKTNARPSVPEPETLTKPITVTENTANITNTIEINYDNQPLVINYEKIPPAGKVSLIPNFAKKEFAQKIASENSCAFAINGGFYTESNKPLGLFLTGGESYGNLSQSSISNGFFWQIKTGVRDMGKVIPGDYAEYEFILQTGPFLTPGDYILKLVTDEKARRSLILKDKSLDLYLASIYEKGDEYSGPNLSDLPKILILPEIKNRLNITQALNLDGGSASFFYIEGGNKPFLLSEITPVGSVICVKN